MDLITFIPGVGPTAPFNPGANTPAPYNVPHTGAVDGAGPATATKNMAELYNRNLLWRRALIANSGLAFDPLNWTQEADAIQTMVSTLVAASSSRQIQPILAVVAAGAMTLTLNPTRLDFRASPLSSGAINSRSVLAAINLVVPSAATLGTTNAIASRLVLLAMDNAGAVELAVINIAGSNNLDETTLISTTAITAGAAAKNVAYSAVARASLPFRVVGYVDSTQAVAGTWATAPSAIQGVGGQALAAMSSLGYGQVWQDVTGSRAGGTTYYNTTGKPIFVHVSPNANVSSSLSFAVNGVVTWTMSASGSNTAFPLVSIVPPGGSYVATFTGTTLVYWAELR